MLIVFSSACNIATRVARLLTRNDTDNLRNTVLKRNLYLSVVKNEQTEAITSFIKLYQADYAFLKHCIRQQQADLGLRVGV